ncbi:hypothetical protein TSAR_006537 [Trichomalopsis sarcophagae]|uniref:Lipoprotein n=1 Tax=Trichomalopsis sarcophagae TaxID=543379 RepID=A0A232FL04_9HYME|nr:hypothetical protein TSAR_006537 [Trichomalopsis sarcophagae]
MDKRIAYIICLMMIGCYSSTLNRNRRQLELDYETTTVPYENTEDEETYFPEEISTVANFYVPEYVQNIESQNDTDLTPEDLLLESIILSFMESGDNFEDIPENVATLQPEVSEPFLTSFLTQREQLNDQIRNLGHDIENVSGKSILFDDWSDPIINAESNIQKINQKKRDVLKKDEGVNAFTRRYAAKYLDEFTQNMDILKKKIQSKYYARYAEKFPDEPAEKIDVAEKYKNLKEIAGIDIEGSSDKSITVEDFTTNSQGSQNIGKTPIN